MNDCLFRFLGCLFVLISSLVCVLCLFVYLLMIQMCAVCLFYLLTLVCFFIDLLIGLYKLLGCLTGCLFVFGIGRFCVVLGVLIDVCLGIIGLWLFRLLCGFGWF